MINMMKQINPVFFHDIKRYHSHIFQQLEQDGDLQGSFCNQADSK